MAFSRYTRDTLRSDGQGLRTTRSISAIRDGVKFGTIPVLRRLIITQADRLDTLAGELYGDARYWWILAAASDIGWSMQVPPGTIITVPDLKKVEKYIG